MDADSWTAPLSSTSKLFEHTLQSRSSDLFLGLDDLELDDDITEEFPCPFCAAYLDIVHLCCHIDDRHPADVRNGVCPVCAVRVKADMVGHIKLQHGNIFKMQRNIKSLRDSSLSTFSLLKKELKERNGGSSYIVGSGNATPDPLLSTFYLPMGDDLLSTHFNSSGESLAVKKRTSGNVSQRKTQSGALSIKEKEERSRRSEFLHGMLLSMILDDKL